MPLSITSSYQNIVANPSTAYKSQASASRRKHASSFRTCDGDTVNISEEAYSLLEANMPDHKQRP